MTPRRIALLDVGKMATTPPPLVPWLVEPLVARGCLTLLAGREGLGKSMLSMAVAVAMATGQEMAGPFRCTAGRVLVIDAENGHGEIWRRVRGLGLDSEAVENLAIGETLYPDVLSDLEELADVISKTNPDLVILDSLRSLWGGKENESDAAGPALDRIQRMARTYDVGVLLLHHASRGGDYRGSTAIGAATEITAVMSRAEGDDDPTRFVIRFAKMRPARRPVPMWLRLSADLGVLELEEAEPFSGADEPVKGRPPVAREELSDKMLRALSGRVLRRADLIRAVGRDSKDRTARRVVDRLVEKAAIVVSDDGVYSLAGGWQKSPDPLGGGHLLPPPEEPDSQGVLGGGTRGWHENGFATPTDQDLGRWNGLAQVPS
jgi:AAA domain